MRGRIALAILLIGAGLAWADSFSPDLSGLASKSDLPTAGTVMPPSTDVNGALGADSSQYARADHTHATSVQRVRMTVQPAGQPVRWSFAKPFDAGIVPVVVCTAQNAAGATRPFVVNTVGDPTNTYADIIIYQAAQPTVALLGVNLTLFGQASAGTIVNCQAAKATQP